MSNYYTAFKELKHTAGKPAGLRGAGTTPSMVEKHGPFPGLPGKAQPRNRSMGVKKVNINAHQEGL